MYKKDVVMSLLDNWRFLVLVCIVCQGAWGIMVKIAAGSLNAPTMSVIGTTTSLIFILAVSYQHVQVTPSWPTLISMLGGVLGGITSLALYRALHLAPASVVIPLHEQYILVTAILAWTILGEDISLKQFTGIVFGLVAIWLLASTQS